MKKGFKHVLRRVILQGTLKRIERINQTMEMKSIVGIIAIRIWREGIDVSNTSNAGLTGINEKKKYLKLTPRFGVWLEESGHHCQKRGKKIREKNQ